MSLSIYGILYTNTTTDIRIAEEVLHKYGPVVITRSDYSEMHNWLDTATMHDRNYICYYLYDGFNRKSSEYILDYVDFAPEADIGLPTDKDQRLQLFIDAIESLLSTYSATDIDIAIADCSEIDCVEVCSFNEFKNSLREMLINQSLPNRIYAVRAI